MWAQFKTCACVLPALLVKNLCKSLASACIKKKKKAACNHSLYWLPVLVSAALTRVVPLSAVVLLSLISVECAVKEEEKQLMHAWREQLAGSCLAHCFTADKCNAFKVLLESPSSNLA